MDICKVFLKKHVHIKINIIYHTEIIEKYSVLPFKLY